MLHLLLGQRRSGFVKHDDLGIEGNRLGDFHHLPLGYGHRAHDGLGVDVDAQLLKDLHGVIVHLLFRNDRGSLDFGIAAQPDVVHYIAAQGLVQLLVHHRDAVVQRLARGAEVDLLAVQKDFAVVFIVDSEEALHQGGFSGAVFAHQRMHRARLDREGHIVQRLNARKALADMLHLQKLACRSAVSGASGLLFHLRPLLPC